MTVLDQHDPTAIVYVIRFWIGSTQGLNRGK
jgi:hypothetical protein